MLTNTPEYVLFPVALFLKIMCVPEHIHGASIYMTVCVSVSAVVCGVRTGSIFMRYFGAGIRDRAGGWAGGRYKHYRNAVAAVAH